MLASPWLDPTALDPGGVVLGAVIVLVSVVFLIRLPRLRLELRANSLIAVQTLSVRRFEFTDCERPTLTVGPTWNGLGVSPVVHYADRERRVELGFWGRRERQQLERFVELVNGYRPSGPPDHRNEGR